MSACQGEMTASAADEYDSAAHRAYLAGDFASAALLIYDAQQLDPGRSGLWDRRQAGIQTAASRSGLHAQTAARLAGAGISTNDPGLARIAHHNAALGISANREGDKDMTAEESAKAGYDTANQVIAGQLNAGMDADRIEAHHHVIAAVLFDDAKPGDGWTFAQEYNLTGEGLIGDLRRDATEAAEHGGGGPSAADMAAGTPHPDAYLADRGWQVSGHGTYYRNVAARVFERDEELEAG